MGDPHPENLATFRTPGGSIVFGFNDLDASQIGPWILDLHRSVQAMASLSETSLGCEESCITEMGEALAEGYVTTLQILDIGLSESRSDVGFSPEELSA